MTSSIVRLYGRYFKSRVENEWHDIGDQSGFRAEISCTDKPCILLVKPYRETTCKKLGDSSHIYRSEKSVK